MSTESRRARAWLSAGAALGIALAARGVVRPARAASGLPADVVALVGDVPVTEAEYVRAVGAVEADRRDHRADPELRRHVLDRLIEEELLVQAAIALGLPTRDPRLRGQIASAMLDGVVGEPAPAPSDEALRAFHASHGASFTRRGRVRIEALFFQGNEATTRAEGALARLVGGEPFAVVASDADPSALPIPSGALPLAKLAEYVGPSAAQTIGALAVGGVTTPLTGPHGTWVARLVARQDGEVATYEEVRSEVLADWRREEDDRRLRRWLDQRRTATRVVVREVLP
ncbi:MAG TPA: peptidylprolyl isomerase [Labilithrix sp.]|nr:peptidylprolyl isomerase [Labilithrix sp.]